MSKFNDMLIDYCWSILHYSHHINKYTHYCKNCHTMVYIPFKTEMDCIKCKYEMRTKSFYICNICMLAKQNYVNTQAAHIKLCTDFAQQNARLRFKLKNELNNYFSLKTGISLST